MDTLYRIQCWSHLSLALAGHCSSQIWFLTKCFFRVIDLSRCCKYRGLIWLKCDIYIKFEMLLRKILFREIQRRAYFCAITVTHSFLLFNILSLLRPLLTLLYVFFCLSGAKDVQNAELVRAL